ncbi:hypothetical protein MIND_00702500 [Mycena indigotica]|uniref:Uncharacterized protein n=1 Tax=Mycena indigotica TaxID=2126181 RepID=A0A8H6SLT3_9AGAR|nr:uncharacterized protein MIND_00702500 [Mycena indigotica]KAF7301373.1 hypothetical protein MIND_00702500 [Mycena indigotica]
MGQRHQIFLVARVVAHGENAARYRCVGAYHHQWCYGRLPLMGARRFITLLKQKDNAKIVKAEIDAIQGQYGKENLPRNVDYVPCPYSLFLVSSAFCIDLENNYASGVTFQHAILDARMGSFDGDNNDGITVFDITDPTNPAYCHVRSRRKGPLSGEEYVRAYYSQHTELPQNPQALAEELDVRAKIDALRGERLMTINVLAEAWPEEYQAENAQPMDEEQKPRQPLPTLVELTLGPAVEHGLKTGELEMLQDMVWHPGKAGAMWPVLQQQNPFPEVGMPLLIEVVQQQVPTTATELDLSGFSLSNQQILTVLEQSKIDDLQLLDLSHNPNISVDVIRLVLGQYPNLRRLILLGTSIANHDLSQMLSAEPALFRSSLQELVHPLLFAIDGESNYPSAFVYVGLHDHNLVKASLPIFSPSAVVQNITDMMSVLADSDSFYFQMNGWVAQAAFSSSYRQEGLPWGERRISCLPSFHSKLPQDPKVRTWIFALQWSLYQEAKYAFLSRDGADGPLTPYDLRGFLAAMEQEGRARVAEASVKKLEEIFVRLKDRAKHLMDEASVAFVSKGLASTRSYGYP